MEFRGFQFRVWALGVQGLRCRALGLRAFGSGYRVCLGYRFFPYAIKLLDTGPYWEYIRNYMKVPQRPLCPHRTNGPLALMFIMAHIPYTRCFRFKGPSYRALVKHGV